MTDDVKPEDTKEETKEIPEKKAKEDTKKK